MTDLILETVLKVAAALAITLIGALGTWLTLKLGKKQELAGIAAAMEHVIQAAQITVGELEQTIVSKLKEDGAKLSSAAIETLGKHLLEKTKEKLSGPAIALLNAAGTDVNALITGAGEEWIRQLRAGA